MWIKLNKHKCAFAQDSIEFLVFELSDKGIRASNRKVDAIVNIKKPENVTQLKSFLGMINYYSKFIKNYADMVGPLYELLKKNNKCV